MTSEVMARLVCKKKALLFCMVEAAWINQHRRRTRHVVRVFCVVLVFGDPWPSWYPLDVYVMWHMLTTVIQHWGHVNRTAGS